MNIQTLKYWGSHFVYRYRNHRVEGHHETNLPIYGLYHILCVNNWKILMEKQISHLKNSGLYDRMDLLLVSAIVSQNKDEEDIVRIGGDKCKVVVMNDSPHVFEFPALEYIRKKSLNEDFYFFYFHTKGISYETNPIYKAAFNFQELKKCVNRWREMMEYFIFDRYKDAITVLHNFDTYGCCYTINEYNIKFFSGNFWWSKSDYIRIIPEMTEEQRKHRFFAEHWICSCSDRNFSQFDINTNPYLSIVPERYYRKDRKLVFSEMISSIINHYQFWIRELYKKICFKFFNNK